MTLRTNEKMEVLREIKKLLTQESFFNVAIIKKHGFFSKILRSPCMPNEDDFWIIANTDISEIKIKFRRFDRFGEKDEKKNHCIELFYHRFVGKHENFTSGALIEGVLEKKIVEDLIREVHGLGVDFANKKRLNKVKKSLEGLVNPIKNEKKIQTCNVIQRNELK